MNLKITPILLAGGSGSRLWPLSRKSYPKQFSNLLGGLSLFQRTALRVSSSDKLNFLPAITITNSDYRFIVAEQLQAAEVETGQIIIEPTAKNTAPAILASSIFAQNEADDAVILVLPSDHIIKDLDEFQSVIAIGLNEILKGNMVNFGILPDHPETGYGYLQVKDISDPEPQKIDKFIEKPQLNQANKMLEAGCFLWNAGIFMFRARDMISAFQRFAPEFCLPVENALSNGIYDLDFLRLDPGHWNDLPNQSIDYAIMEKTDNLVAVPLSAGWSDLGGWDTVWGAMTQNDKAVALSTNAHAINCENTLLRSESDSQQIVGLGLENIIAVAMPDAVLVCSKSNVQDVKQVVDYLKLEGVSQAELYPKDHRPWGWFESLAISDRFQVKRICVSPGAALSLQSHHHRSEHWIVVEGTANVTVEEKNHLITEGESVYIPLGAVHRMTNPGKLPLVIIEVQTGGYLGEDDITRYEDLYSRN